MCRTSFLSLLGARKETWNPSGFCVTVMFPCKKCRRLHFQPYWIVVASRVTLPDWMHLSIWWAQRQRGSHECDPWLLAGGSLDHGLLHPVHPDGWILGVEQLGMGVTSRHGRMNENTRDRSPLSRQRKEPEHDMRRSETAASKIAKYT